MQTPRCWRGNEQPSIEITAAEQASSPAVEKKNILKFRSRWTGLSVRGLKSDRKLRDSDEICLGSRSLQDFAYCRNYAVLLALMLDRRLGFPHSLSYFSGEWGWRESDLPLGSTGQWVYNLKCLGREPVLTSQHSSVWCRGWPVTHRSCAGWWYQHAFCSSGHTVHLNEVLNAQIGRLTTCQYL